MKGVRAEPGSVGQKRRGLQLAAKLPGGALTAVDDGDGTAEIAGDGLSDEGIVGTAQNNIVDVAVPERQEEVLQVGVQIRLAVVFRKAAGDGIGFKVLQNGLHGGGEFFIQRKAFALSRLHQSHGVGHGVERLLHHIVLPGGLAVIDLLVQGLCGVQRPGQIGAIGIDKVEIFAPVIVAELCIGQAVAVAGQNHFVHLPGRGLAAGVPGACQIPDAGRNGLSLAVSAKRFLKKTGNSVKIMYSLK